ncbi:hypothetical protein A5646_03575 [Mycobacterium sp. 1245499.0]|uniref:DUF7374 family protein n=1 Tax=Mycobacterium sp. 1245499.0 TaxID=1834074 RepID=UPI000801A8D5|nr:hypothetical protein [Mycobacterium sp. 1245499.0]OBK92394.1 hypothetical protein A5646_03575 [Mycobacterium sp. 1245499.0]
MNEADIIAFLAWLEAVFDNGIGFPNKQALASGYVAHLNRSVEHDGMMGHDELVNRVANAMWTALEAQDGIYVDRAMDMIDASGSGVDMHAVAASLIEQLQVDVRDLGFRHEGHH